MFVQLWTSFESHKHVHTMYRSAHTGLDSCCDHQWSCQCICACIWSTYNTHMDWYMCMYMKHIQLTYARTYAPDIRQSISHMHGLYWIHTKIYLHVYPCICMYLLSLRGCIKCIFACMSYTYRHIHRHMDWFRSMHMCMYVAVCLA
jgi:hypothetical protein